MAPLKIKDCKIIHQSCHNILELTEIVQNRPNCPWFNISNLFQRNWDWRSETVIRKIYCRHAAVTDWYGSNNRAPARERSAIGNVCNNACRSQFYMCGVVWPKVQLPNVADSFQPIKWCCCWWALARVDAPALHLNPFIYGKRLI